MKVTADKEIDFESIYKKHFNTIYLFCCSLINNKQQGLDLAQDAFHRLWEKWDAENYEEHSILAFLYTTARHLCYDTIRYRHQTEELDEQIIQKLSDTTFFLDKLTEQETRRHVREMITQLSGRKQEIITLAIKGKNNTEIADILQISVNTVKTLKKDAYSQLRVLLKNDIYMLVCLLIV